MTERGTASHSWLRVVLPALATLLVVASCTERTIVQVSVDDVASVSLSPDTAQVAIGRTVRISAEPLSTVGVLLAGLPITWAIDDPSIASVDESGTVTGVASGTTEVVAVVGSFEARGTVVVAPAPAIALSSSSVGFTAEAGAGDPGDEDVSITNGGGFSLIGLAVDSIVYGPGATGWLGAQLSGAAAPATLTLSAMTAGLTTAGTYTATVWLSAVDADNSPSSVQVALDITPSDAAQIDIDAGDGQSAAAGAAVTTDPSVLVTDPFDNPVSGADVTFAVTSGGGSVTGASTTTNASGIATVGSWTMGPLTGVNTLQASITAGASVEFTATATPGAADAIQVSSGDGQSATAGAEVANPPAAIVVDAFGNGVPGVDVSFAVTGGGGSVTGASTTTDAFGVATVGSWTLGATVGPNTLEATASGVAGAATFTATALSGQATEMLLDAGDAQTDTVAATLPVDFSVRVVDTNGNGVSGVPVAWSVTGGGGSVTTSSTTDANGFATATRVLGTTAGPQTATASVGGLIGSPVTFTATATAGAAAQVSVEAGDGQNATVATAVATAPQARVEDQFGNPIAGHSVTFAVTAGGGQVAPTAAVTTDASGIAAATSWTLGTAAGTDNNSLTATAAGAGLAGNPVSFTASATADAPASIQISAGDGQSAIAGVNVATPPAVLVRDQFNNPVPGATVDFSASGSGSVGSGSVDTNGSGIASTTWRVETGGAVMATDGTFANTLTATVQGTAISVPFSATASYSYAAHVDPIWTSGNCLGCHGGTSGLTFPGDPAGNHAAITVNAAPTCDGTLGADYRIVSTAGGVQAADDFSILIRMIDTNLALLGGCDRRMPNVDGGLSAATVDTIRAWVRNGAPNNE